MDDGRRGREGWMDDVQKDGLMDGWMDVPKVGLMDGWI